MALLQGVNYVELDSYFGNGMFQLAWSFKSERASYRISNPLPNLYQTRRTRRTYVYTSGYYYVY